MTHIPHSPVHYSLLHQNSVYCSHPTKTILQRTATASERVHYDVHGVKSDDYYTFPNLQQPIFDSRGRRVIKNGKKLRMEVLVGVMWLLAIHS